MLVVMLDKGGCNNLAIYIKVVGSKAVVVGSCVVVVAGVLVVDVGDLNVVNLLSIILRFLWHHMLLMHRLHLLLHSYQSLMKSKTL